MPTAQDILTAISQVKNQQTFVEKLLRDTLCWPIPEGTSTVEDIAYEWPLEDFRAIDLDQQLLDRKILQIQPLDPGVDQPWGIFILRFRSREPFLKERGMTTVLRNILKDLVPKARRDPDRPAWTCEHLLFICTYEYQNFRFAYFKPSADGSKAEPLAGFGWNPPQPARTVCEYNLKELEWPSARDQADAASWVKKWAKAFDVEKVTKKFFEDYSEVFEAAENRLQGTIPDDKARRLFTQRLFNRLMFLRFIEQKHWLQFQGRTDYLRALQEAGGTGGQTLYKSRLEPLFFEALAIQGRQTSHAIGSVKYLNGGLFERQPEDNLVTDIPDSAFEPIISGHGLFYKYNFTVEESTPLNIQVAVDPEMLGKVFEKLVTGRKDKGAYYTPRQIVSFMCKETLKGYLGGFEELIDNHNSDGITVAQARQLLQKLYQVKVIDPACGSGAYLLGMLHELVVLHRLLETRAQEPTPHDYYQLKLRIIQNNLYGVDIEAFAANTACLRLWLSIAVEFEGDDPPPLPNLDFKIGVGDSLTAHDPHDVKIELAQKPIREFAEKKAQYASGHLAHQEKLALAAEINQLKDSIKLWLRPGVAENGFDWAVEFAEVFLPRAADASITGELNLGDQLAAPTVPGGFDIAIANPPYGAQVVENVRDLYFNRRTEGAQSKDTYGLFMARALQLLRSGGQFSFIVSDTWRTIKSHMPLRKRLLDQTMVKHVLDLPAWIFDATVNTGIIALSKERASKGHKLIAGDLRPIENDNWESLSRNLLAVASHGFDAQTLTYARYTYPQDLISSYINCSFFIGSPSIYRYMGDPNYRKLGDIADVKVGLQTGDNEYYLRKRTRARGGYQVLDETKLMTEEEIVNLSENEKRNGVNLVRHGGRYFVPYDKGGESDPEGGWLPNYYVPTSYFIDWSEQSVTRLKTYRPVANSLIGAAVIRNSDYYFRNGITFSYTGFYAPCFRLSSGSVFDVGGSSCFVHAIPTELCLGILASRFNRYVARVCVDNTVNYQVDEFKQLLIPCQFPNGEDATISRLVAQILSQQKRDSQYSYDQNEQKDIDQAVYGLFGLQLEQIRDIELWYCRRYPKLAEAQGFMAEVKEKYADYLAHCEYVLSKPPRYWRSHPALGLIAQGECQQAEFKESLEYDIATRGVNTDLRRDVLKTICAFLNSQGGTLLIGVSDAGQISGLERDFALCGRNQNADGFQLKLRGFIDASISPAPIGFVDVQFQHFPEGTLCQVIVTPSTDICYYEREEVYVRDGNRSIRLQGRKLSEWVQRRSQ